MQNKKPTVTAHVLVKNEEVYISAAINSVLPYVDKMIIFDTGSTDSTISLIKEIISEDTEKKIIFEEKGDSDKQRHTELRNEMVKLTKTDWFMVLDGDEVWPKDQINFVIQNDLSAAELLQRNCILVSYHLSSVDLNHYTESGHYESKWGLHGHFAFRFFRNLNGINWGGEYGKDSLFYKNGSEVVEQNNILFSTAYFWHLSKLYRSSNAFQRIAGIKPTKLKYIPKFLQKKLVKKNKYKIPETLHEYRQQG